MTNGALGIRLLREGDRLSASITAPEVPPVVRMMVGRPPEEVARLMPMLFNLCGAAQGLAVRLSLGLPETGADARREILRDHLAKLCLHWPRLLGLAPQPLPEGWAAGGPALSAWLWGGARPDDLDTWLAAGAGVAPVLAEIRARFAPGEAIADLPPLTDPAAITAQENSPAGRMADDPLMLAAEAVYGRGPFWRALGRVLDLDRLANGPAEAERRADGAAFVDAARGTYAFHASAENGAVTALARVTPTDHLLAPGGALSQSLDSLPAAKAGLAALVVDILDPCVPVLLSEAEEEEAQDA